MIGGEHTETATGVSEEIRIAQSESKPYFLLNGRADTTGKKPKATAEIALFYFAGHGHIEATSGYLLATKSARGDEGLSLSDVLTYANWSTRAEQGHRVGHLARRNRGHTAGDLATLSEGLTVLTASTADQYATEENGRGVFTHGLTEERRGNVLIRLMVDALYGGAANLTGDITPGECLRPCRSIPWSLGTTAQSSRRTCGSLVLCEKSLR